MNVEEEVDNILQIQNEATGPITLVQMDDQKTAICSKKSTRGVEPYDIFQESQETNDIEIMRMLKECKKYYERERSQNTDFPLEEVKNFSYEVLEKVNWTDALAYLQNRYCLRADHMEANLHPERDWYWERVLCNPLLDTTTAQNLKEYITRPCINRDSCAFRYYFSHTEEVGRIFLSNITIDVLNKSRIDPDNTREVNTLYNNVCAMYDCDRPPVSDLYPSVGFCLCCMLLRQTLNQFSALNESAVNIYPRKSKEVMIPLCLFDIRTFANTTHCKEQDFFSQVVNVHDCNVIQLPENNILPYKIYQKSMNGRMRWIVERISDNMTSTPHIETIMEKCHRIDRQLHI